MEGVDESKKKGESGKRGWFLRGRGDVACTHCTVFGGYVR